MQPKSCGLETSTSDLQPVQKYGLKRHKVHELQVEAAGDSNVAEVLASQQGGRRRAREGLSGMAQQLYTSSRRMQPVVCSA